MTNIGPYGSPTVVFTAAAAGIHTFVLIGTGELSHNSDALSEAASDNGQKHTTIHMAQGDTLEYVGSAAQISGARLRLGDEL